jgi:hypothetical protein
MNGAGSAAQRAADALLRTVGGKTVKLRVPAPATPGDVTEQLGLAAPEFQDVPLALGVFRKARAAGAVGEAARSEVIVSATSVLELVGSLGYESVAVMFEAVAGVLVDERLLFIERCTASQVGGEIYCYRLSLREPVAVLV